MEKVFIWTLEYHPISDSGWHTRSIWATRGQAYFLKKKKISRPITVLVGYSY